MRKFFAKIHLWLSLPLGILISILCLTGAILVFEQELKECSNSSLYKVQPGDSMLKPSELMSRVLLQMGDTLQVNTLQLSGKEGRTAMITFKETGRKSLSVNPYTGEVQGWVESSSFFQTVRKLHRWLMNPPATKGEKSVGKVVTGVSTLLFVFILVSGIVIWWPRSRRALKNRLSVSFTKGWRRFWYDSHVAWGFYSTLFLLLMALTGLTWSFGWYRTLAYGLFGVDTAKPAASGHAPQETSKKNREEKKPSKVSPTLHWDDVLATLQAQYPAYSQITLQDGQAQVGINLATSMRKNDTVRFNPESGEITQITRYEDVPLAQKMKGIFYAFHTGSWGGICTKILYFLACLIGALLPWSGYYLWWKKR